MDRIKKWMMGIWLALMTSTLHAQDYVVIESFIKSHKELSDKLKERTQVETAVLASHVVFEEANKKYQEVVDTLSNRMASLNTDASFVSEVTKLILDLNTTVTIADDTYLKALDVCFRHPEVLDMVDKLNEGMSDRITEIYNLTSMTISGGLRLNLATPQQRHSYLRMVDARILWIAMSMKSLYAYCCMVEKSDLRNGSPLRDIDAEGLYRRAKYRIDNMEWD